MRTYQITAIVTGSIITGSLILGACSGGPTGPQTPAQVLTSGGYTTTLPMNVSEFGTAAPYFTSVTAGINGSSGAEVVAGIVPGDAGLISAALGSVVVPAGVTYKITGNQLVMSGSLAAFANVG